MNDYELKNSKMNYLERLEYLSGKVGYINMQLKTVVNEYEASEFIKENLDKLVNIMMIYKDDIELNKHMHMTILEIMEVAPRVPNAISLEMLIKIIETLLSYVYSELPENLKLGKILLEMEKNSNEISDIIGVSPLEFSNIMKKMNEHNDEIAASISFSQKFR